MKKPADSKKPSTPAPVPNASTKATKAPKPTKEPVPPETPAATEPPGGAAVASPGSPCAHAQKADCKPGAAGSCQWGT